MRLGRREVLKCACALRLPERRAGYRAMNTAGLEQIANTQEYFDVIQRFVQKIGCTAMQGPPFGFLVDVGRQDDDCQVNLALLGPQGFENREPIRIWHEQIEQNQVCVELVAKFEDTAGISRDFSWV